MELLYLQFYRDLLKIGIFNYMKRIDVIKRFTDFEENEKDKKKTPNSFPNLFGCYNSSKIIIINILI